MHSHKGLECQAGTDIEAGILTVVAALNLVEEVVGICVNSNLKFPHDSI